MSIRLDLRGKRFGRWTVLHDLGRNRDHHSKWLCRCDCGAERPVIGANLNRGASQSCGCVQREKAAETLRSVATKHGYTRYQEYSAYRSMIHRCTSKDDLHYHLYGGRGITVCDRWMSSFPAFLEDMGRRPGRGYTIERKDTDKGYSPDNCIWIPGDQQSKNTRRNVRICALGKEMTLAEWARETGISQGAIRSRMRELGWTADMAVSVPARKIRKSQPGGADLAAPREAPHRRPDTYCIVSQAAIDYVANALSFLGSLGYGPGGDIYDGLTIALKQLHNSRSNTAEQGIDVN